MAVKRRKSRWSFREDRKFVEMARTLSVLELSKQFRITPEAVEMKLIKMGAAVRPNPTAYSEAIRRLSDLGLSKSVPSERLMAARTEASAKNGRRKK